MESVDIGIGRKNDLAVAKVVERLLDVEKTIKFYMGSNTPERKDYIMDSLVCDASEY